MASYKPNQGVTQLKVLFRANPLPIDSSEIWESLHEAQSYISQANAYAGQTIKVKLEDGKYHQFILQSAQEGYELQEFGISPDQIESLELELDTKSPLENPAFIGTVTIGGEKAATQDWVNTIIGQLNSGIPGIVDGTENPFPSTGYKAGQMWRVAAKGTYAGAVCEIGDLIICLKDYVEDSAGNADFMVVQANIDGAVTGADSSTDGHIVVFNGSTGKVIKESNVAIASLNDVISKAHEHSNKTQLDSFSKTQIEILSEASVDAQSKVSALSDSIALKLNDKVDSTTVDAKIETVKSEGLEAIEAGIQELENGQVATNKNDIATLKSGKADKSTTLAGYGIADAYTKSQTDSAIATAVAKADHLKRKIVEELPDPGEADENTIYMVGTGEGSEDSSYEEYMLVNGAFEKIGSSAVDLTDYAKKSEVTTAKSEAIATADTNTDSKIAAKVGSIDSSTVKEYVDQAKEEAISSAKTYSDGLSKNYATATQGAKAETALQKEDIVSGTENGTIAVRGADVAVKGLKSAAYYDASDFVSTEIIEGLETGLAKKLDKNQGTENAGKTLVVGSDGNVAPSDSQSSVDMSLAIKNQASGEVPIIVTDSSGQPIQDLGMEGRTEQESTTGAQLFDCNLIPDREHNGITFTNNNDGSIRISGTSTAQAFTAPIPISIPPGTYFVSDNNDKSDAWTFYVGTRTSGTDENWADNRNYAFTVTETDSVRAYVSVTSGQTLDVTIYPMLNSGSEAKPWEPYTGGQPSPSPDYPQEIVSAGEYNEETQKWEYDISLKNGLLDDSLWDAENWQVYGENPSVGYKSFLVQAKPNTIYTVSRKDDKGIGLNVYLCVNLEKRTTNSGVFLIASISEDRNKQSVQVSTNDTGIILITSSSFNNLAKVKEIAEYIQIDEGTEALPYREPKVQDIILQSDRPLTKWDRLEKRDGQWGWVFRSAEIVLDGSEAWNNYSQVYSGYAVSNLLPFSDVRREGYSDRLIVRDKYINENVPSLWLGVDNSSIYAIHLSQYNANLPDYGVSDFKEWLSENPITILTYLDEETFIPLTASEQEQMNALHTNYPTTVLMNDQGCEMSLKYVADTNNYIGQNFVRKEDYTALEARVSALESTAVQNI